MCDVGVDIGVPGFAVGLSMGGPVGGGRSGHRGPQRLKSKLGVAHNSQRLMLGRVLPPDVQPDQPRFWREDRPGAGGEILEPGADGKDHAMADVWFTKAKAEPLPELGDLLTADGGSLLAGSPAGDAPRQAAAGPVLAGFARHGGISDDDLQRQQQLLI